MTITNKNIILIAPGRLLNAFRILFQSTPNIDLLAAEVSLTAIQKKIEKRPDLVITYLTKERPSMKGKGITPKVIKELKSIWPDVYIIAIVNDIQQRAKVQTLGADEVLFDGIKPARLLVVIEEIDTANS